MDWTPVFGIVAALLGVWVFLIALLWVFRPKDTHLADLVRAVPDILRLIRSLLGDPSTPRSVRFALLGLLAYMLNPIDLIPEFVPVLGPLDDIVVAVIVLRYVDRRVGDAELRRCWRGTDESYALLRQLL